MIPAQIESSMFAILTGITNFCNFFIANQFGNLINIWVGVTDDNLEKLWVLEAIMAAFAIVPIAFVCLIPTRKEVFKYQQVNDFLEKYPPKEQE